MKVFVFSYVFACIVAWSWYLQVAPGSHLPHVFMSMSVPMFLYPVMYPTLIYTTKTWSWTSLCHVMYVIMTCYYYYLICLNYKCTLH